MTFLETVRRRIPEYPPYYEAPAGNLLRLDQNANLLGPNPAVVEAKLETSRAHLYPSRDNSPLIAQAAKTFRVDANQVFVGNGSDEILDVVLRTLVPPRGRVATPHPSYSMYPHLCRLNRVTHVKVPMDAQFRLTAQGLLEAKPDLILLANPNNPTGSLVDGRVIGQLLSEFDGPVLIDEAYGEFSGATLLSLVGRNPNLLVSRTLSKAAGLAGLRVGLGFAHADVAELIRRNKIPFSVNILSEQVAIAALQRNAYIEETIARLTKEREKLSTALKAIGFSVVPSAANFLLTLPPIASEELYDALKRDGILARRFPHEPSLRDYIRFTVGRPEDNARLLASLAKVLDAEVGS